jgi:hypothetical protein
MVEKYEEIRDGETIPFSSLSCTLKMEAMSSSGTYLPDY